jgi:hypothetical protein
MLPSISAKNEDETLITHECYFQVYNPNADILSDFDEHIYNGINFYNTCVNCPKTYQNIDTKEKCEGIQKNVDDFTVVSDLQGIVYRKRYCSGCNDVNTTMSWNLILNCRVTKYLIEIQPELETLDELQDCMMWSLPPELSVGRPFLC